MPIDAFSYDLDGLRELVSQLSSERDAALAECKRVTEQNDRLRHLLQQLRRAQFGRKSERLDPEQLQLAIEDLETAVAAEAAEQDKTATIEEAPKKKRKTNRGSLPAHLPRVHITLAPDSTACPCCHGVMHVIGEETAERLDKIPAQYQVIVTHRPKYGCRACEGAIVQAPSAGASDQRRHSHGKPCRRCRGRQIRLAQTTLPPGADHAAAGLTGRSLDIGWLGWRRRSRNQAGLSTDERNRARFGESRGWSMK